MPEARFISSNRSPNAAATLGAKGVAIQWMAKHHLLPEAYLYGAAYILMHLERYAFWNGDYSTSGWRLFFPYCFLVKTPLPLLALAGTLAAIALRRLKLERRTSSLYEIVPLWSLIGVYACIAISSTLNIGHRYILPLYPPLFILCGGAAAWLRSKRATMRMLLPVLLALFLVESARAYPHYLAYFNQITGREHAYEHLADSSLDWGQDLPGLKQWLDRHGWDGSPKRRVFLTYFGTAEPEHYGIRASLLPVERIPPNPSPPQPGLYCVTNVASMRLRASARRSGPTSTRHPTRRCVSILKACAICRCRRPSRRSEGPRGGSSSERLTTC